MKFNRGGDEFENTDATPKNEELEAKNGGGWFR